MGVMYVMVEDDTCIPLYTCISRVIGFRANRNYFIYNKFLLKYTMLYFEVDVK